MESTRSVANGQETPDDDARNIVLSNLRHTGIVVHGSVFPISLSDASVM